MRFLIVDDSVTFRSTIAGMLRARWPAAETEEWDPRRRGRPREALAPGRYSAVILDANPAGEDGFAWIAALRDGPDAPPVVLLTDEGGEYLAVKAMKAGAADFLRKAALTPERLARSVEDALREQTTRELESSGAEPALARTAPLDVRRIGSPVRNDVIQVPGYRTLRMIGRGGMAQVYLAERERDGAQLVLKVLDPGLQKDQTFLQRFVREYKLIAGIENEHVARVFDQGFAGERPYIAMEYLSGGTLAVRMHEGLTSLAALRVTSQIAKALDAVHAHGIVHRDLKPQNIMFRETGRPAIVDFGLARSLVIESKLTRAGEVMATPRYMSPEQCMGLQADHRSDLYSLGVMFYEMLTGRKLFESEGTAGLVYMHVHGDVPRLPPRLAGYQPIVDRLLAKKPADRFQSARELFATIVI
jgi:FixJ family two-component response regulator